MDERIEAFLKDVPALEGEISNLLREGVRRHLAIYEKQFRDAETQTHEGQGGRGVSHVVPRPRSRRDTAT